MPQWGCSLGRGNHSHTVRRQSQHLIRLHFSLDRWFFFLYVCGNREKWKLYKISCVAFENVWVLHFKWKYQIAIFHMSEVNFSSASNWIIFFHWFLLWSTTADKYQDNGTAGTCLKSVCLCVSGKNRHDATCLLTVFVFPLTLLQLARDEWCWPSSSQFGMRL